MYILTPRTAAKSRVLRRIQWAIVVGYGLVVVVVLLGMVGGVD